MDLISAGNIGLIKAATRYDETRGFKFISYAVWWIRQSILQALAEHSRLIRLPLNHVANLSKISQTFERLKQQKNRSPSIDEVAASLDVEQEQIFDTLKVSHYHLSLQATLNDDEEKTFVEIIEDTHELPPDAALIEMSVKTDVREALDSLSKRQRDVLQMYFGIDRDYTLNLEDIGEKFDITKERVRQIKEMALRHLRHKTRSKKLKPYLD